MRRHRSIIVLVTGSLLLGLAGCAGDSLTSSSAPPSTLQVAQTQGEPAQPPSGVGQQTGTVQPPSSTDTPPSSTESEQGEPPSGEIQERGIPRKPLPGTDLGGRLLEGFVYYMSVLPLDAAFAINKSDAIAGRVGGNAAVYTNGSVVLLPGKVGYSALTAIDIADNGFIVGTGLSAGNQRGLFWSSTTAAPLDMGALGNMVFPMAVNSQGIVVGYYTLPGSAPQAFRWSRTSGMERIAPATTSQSRAYDISDTGYIAGMAFYNSIGQQVVRWTLDGTPGRFNGSEAYRALSNGSIFGIGPSGATLWPLTGVPINIGPNPATHFVKQMSAAGRLVGFTQNYRAWTTGEGSNTPLYLPVPAGTLNSYANDVSACGTILGSVKLSTNIDQFVIWKKRLCDDLLEPAVKSNKSLQ